MPGERANAASLIHQRAPRAPDPAKPWLAFLEITEKPLLRWISSRFRGSRSGVLDCFFVIAHDRRRILRFNVTTSDPPVDRSAVVRSVSIWVNSQVSDLRPRCEVRVGDSSGRSIPENHPEPNFFRESLGKRCCGAVQPSEETAQPCDSENAVREPLFMQHSPHCLPQVELGGEQHQLYVVSKKGTVQPTGRGPTGKTPHCYAGYGFESCRPSQVLEVNRRKTRFFTHPTRN